MYIRSRFPSSVPLLAACIAALAAPSARAADARHVLLSQHVWETQRGFYVDLENVAADDKTPAPLDTLKLALAVGDGKAWHFATAAPTWAFGQTYKVIAKIDGAHATLSLDGKEVGRVDDAPLAPSATDLTGALVPEWAKAPTAYEVVQRSIKIASRGHIVAEHEWPNAGDPGDAVRRLFSPQSTWYDGSWHPDAANASFEVEITFSLERPAGDLHALAPFIDEFGQVKYGQWDTKVTDEAQLKSDVADEQKRLATMPPAAGGDVYGGSASLGWRETGSGFYRVVRHGKQWWLITPTGLPCFYTGVCTAPMLTGNGTPVKGREYVFADLPPKDGPFAAAWGKGVWGEADNEYVSFDTANLIRKFGDGWQAKEQALTTQRLKAFGFSGLGKWSEPYGGVPYVGCLFHPKDPPSGKGKLDVFDDAARAQFVAAIREQIEPKKDDPFLVGWSVGNERPETVLNDDLAAMLAAPTATPAKLAMIKHAIATIYGNDAAKCAAAWKATGTTAEQIAAQPLVAPAADVEPLRQFFADAYYKFIQDTVKSLDANHLYLGYWIVPGWWQNESDWSLIAKHCDVIGYDHYAETFVDPSIEKLIAQTDMPVLCGEFSYPPTYGGERGMGAFFLVTTPDEKTSGERYQRWMQSAGKNPWCVGGLWFEYRDEPVTGRGPGSGPALTYDEHYAFGIVDVTDRPKWAMVERMRDANLRVADDRMRAAK